MERLNNWKDYNKWKDYMERLKWKDLNLNERLYGKT